MSSGWNMLFDPKRPGWIPPEDRTVDMQRSHERFLDDTPPVSEVFHGGYNEDRPRIWQLVRQAHEKGLIPDQYMRNGTLKNLNQLTGSCFPAGTLVRMADGSERPIDEIQVGDRVISHTGQPRRVLRTFCRKYTGELVTIRVASHPFPLTATSDHRIATVPFRGKKFSLQSADMNRFGWTEAENLTTDSRVLIGRMNAPERDPSIVIDVAKILGDDAIETDVIRSMSSRSHSRPWAAAKQLEKEERESGKNLSGRVTIWRHRYKYAVYRYIPWTASLARLLGLYVAEGGVDNNRVTFTFSSDEDNLASEVVALVSGIFGVDGTIRKEPEKGRNTVRFDSSVLSRVLKHLAPGDVWTKRVPPLVFQSGVSSRLAFLRGWLDGDGYRRSRNGLNQIIGVTVSEQLARDLSALAVSCGLTAALHRRKKRGRSKPAFNVDFYGDSTAPLTSPGSAVKAVKSVKRHRFGIARRVLSTHRQHVTDTNVYCLEVEEDHSFLANGLCVSNCVGFGAGNALLWASVVDAIHRRQQERIVVPCVLYHYGRGRLHSGIRGRGEGSTGSGQAKALQQDGYLAFDSPNCPSPQFADVVKWSSGLEMEWSDGARIGEQYLTEGRQHLTPNVVRVTSLDEAQMLLDSYYVFTIASSWGGMMRCPVQDGVLLNRRTGTWMHQMWCLHGDTKIPLLNGTEANIRDIAETGEPVWVYAYHNGRVVPQRATGFKTRESVPEGMVRVTLDNGESVVATLDHKFMRRDGSYTEAQYLTPGDSLMPLYRRLSTDADCKHRVGYEMVMDPGDESYRFTHRRVAESVQLLGLRYKDGVERVIDDPGPAMATVHHYDHDKRNNSPDNLYRMLKREHWRLHADVSDGKHLAKCWDDPAFRDMRRRVARETMLRLRQDEAFMDKLRSGASANMTRLNSDPEFVQAAADRLVALTKERFQSEEVRQEQARLLRERFNDPQFVANIAEANRRKAQDPEWRRKQREASIRGRAEKLRVLLIEHGYDPETQWDEGRDALIAAGIAAKQSPRVATVRRLVPTNHKVVSVIFLPHETGPTYCLKVPNYHNFAVSAGVFVHNCLDYITHPRLGRLWWVGNNWGYVHGKDPGGEWDGNTGAPEGGFYISDSDMSYIIRQNETFAFADPQGFVDRSRLSWRMF